MSEESKINILLVDDENSNFLVLEAILQSLKQNLVKASSGKEALRQVLDHDFAVILLDVQMPVMNGIETAAAIREREKSRHIPIIFLTGMVRTDEMMFKGYSAGAVDYLMKPLQPDILRAKVEVFVELALARQKLQREISERTRIAQEVTLLNQELAANNQMLEERTSHLQETISELESYSYSISHDMRAPLRVMQGYAEILVDECAAQLTPEYQNYLRKIASGAHRLDQLIKDVLSYSQISRSQFQLEPIDLDKLAREIIDQYPELQSPDFHISILNKLPPVWANEAILTQCLSNLLGNATKFVLPGTFPEIKLYAELQNDHRVRLYVEDNGIGIDPKDKDRIFGIFVKIHSPEAYTGTGIGLSIVRRSVEKLGGQVGVESELGKGSRFWIELKSAETL